MNSIRMKVVVSAGSVDATKEWGVILNLPGFPIMKIDKKDGNGVFLSLVEAKILIASLKSIMSAYENYLEPANLAGLVDQDQLDEDTGDSA